MANWMIIILKQGDVRAISISKNVFDFIDYRVITAR